MEKPSTVAVIKETANRWAFLDSKIPAEKLGGWVLPGTRACSPGACCLHVRPKMDSGSRMFDIVVHLTMFASGKHSAATVHFEAGHCKQQAPGEQALVPGKTQLEVVLRVGILESKNGVLALTVYNN